MTDKKVVYTDEVVARMVETYTAAESDEARASVVQEFVDELGVKVQSVRAKLVNLGVYKAKSRKTKTGDPIEDKNAIVSDIAKLMQKNEERVESLAKATKPVLKMVRDALRARTEDSSEG